MPKCFMRLILDSEARHMILLEGLNHLSNE